MKIPLAKLAACMALALLPVRTLAAEEVARVVGVAIDRSELQPAPDGPETELGRFYDRVWSGVSRHYIEQNGLNATPQEITELLDYEREFQRKDRAQRARKLAELEQRLAAPELSAAERAWLDEFRATLVRLARADAESDRAPPPDPAREAARRAQWIEIWKLNRALYAQYGGVVALTRVGPFPYGARLALIEDYERRGLLRFEEADLRERLLAGLAVASVIALPPEQVDFTPYWKRPIPPSYFPD
jgi:hypothetical protein